jgi:PAS domain S-box-containing protein
MKRDRVYLPPAEKVNFFLQEDDRFQRMLAVLESSFDGIFLADADAKAIWCNHSYEVISGLKAEQVVGQSMQEIETSGVISKSCTLLAMERGEAVTIDQSFRTGKHAIVTSTPIYDHKDMITMVVTNVRDISELIELEESLKKQKSIAERYESEISVIREQLLQLPELVADDPKTLNLLRIVGRAANMDTVMLILGETGVGKERIASYIHRKSPRCNQNFIRVNCGAIPENLAESELFGYERGAFTGANREGKPGLFEVADHGTIFLDEVGELSLNLQTKLLRVLQEREFTRVGGNKPVKVDVRVIAATNSNLLKAVEAGKFREDLYYRLSVFPVVVPPLRERKEDIPRLAANTLRELNQHYAKHKRISSEAYAALNSYQWPGNVRELRNVIERAFIMSDESEISVSDLALFYGSEPIKSIEGSGSFQEQVEHFEAQLIAETIKEENSIRGAARKLQMDPATFLRKKQKYQSKNLF